MDERKFCLFYNKVYMVERCFTDYNIGNRPATVKKNNMAQLTMRIATKGKTARKAETLVNNAVVAIMTMNCKGNEMPQNSF